MTPKVNKKLLPMKAHYFFFNAGLFGSVLDIFFVPTLQQTFIDRKSFCTGTAPVVPFMPTLAKQLGFSSVVVGTIYTILPLIGLLVKPLFGAIADKYVKNIILINIMQN